MVRSQAADANFLHLDVSSYSVKERRRANRKRKRERRTVEPIFDGRVIDFRWVADRFTADDFCWVGDRLLANG